MISIGMDIEQMPFMCDRGHLVSAVRFIYATSQMVVTLKFCIEHIIRNVVTKFNIMKKHYKELREVIGSMQSSATYEQFLEKMTILVFFENHGK